tara:strand:+ start:970 stop:1515 length:546 start_codon:yes stop_codon:yes gene_type:complete
MSEISPIKDVLYAEIDKIGQEQIHTLLVEEKFSELFEKIYESSINKIDGDLDEYEKHGTLAESFTHYLFTEMLIPSQRKITFENIELDMIIPNTAELKKNINNVVLLHFVKTSKNDEIKLKIQKMKEIQKSDANIWVISKENISIPQVSFTTKRDSFSRFLKDVQDFVKIKEMNKLNIFKT